MLKQLSAYLHNCWRDLHVSSGCVCLDKNVALLNALKEALIEDLHAIRPGTWGMVSMDQHCRWPYMSRDLLACSKECKPCTAIGKKCKINYTLKQYHRATPNDHRAMGLVERNISIKKQRLACIKEAYKESISFTI